MPAKAGIQWLWKVFLDSSFRWNDVKGASSAPAGNRAAIRVGKHALNR
jgi:hypothetical protein